MSKKFSTTVSSRHLRGEPTPLPYRIRTLGRNIRLPYHSTPGTRYDDAMFTLVLDGKGHYLREGARESVERGMVGLVLPQPAPGLLMADPADPYDHYYCRFAGGEALRVCSRILNERGLGKSFFYWSRWEEGADLLRKMHSVFDAEHIAGATQSPQNERLCIADAMLAQLLAMLDSPKRSLDTVRLNGEALRQYLNDRLSEPVDLEAMAVYFKVSKHHLCRVARRSLNTTLQQLSERLKMEWAMVLLREPSLRVAEVSRRVGYEDPFYFSKVFKKYTGKNPRDWRAGSN